MLQLGQILKQKIQKDRKSPTAAFEEPGAKLGVDSKRYCTCPSAVSITRGMGGSTQATLEPNPWTHSCPHPPNERRDKLAATQGASEQGDLLFVVAPYCCNRGPCKASPGLPVWPVVNVY